MVSVLARISKKLVQNSNFKYSARPDLATQLLKNPYTNYILQPFVSKRAIYI